MDAEARRLEVYLDFKRGSGVPVGTAGPWAARRDTMDKTWRHLDFLQHEAYRHARLPRAACDDCGVELVGVSWARTGGGFTPLFEAMVKAMPVAAVSRLVGERGSRLSRVLHHYVDTARAEVSCALLHRDRVERLLERALEGELSDHLGYEKHEVEGRNGGNSRSGRTRKRVKTDTAEMEIEVPRDRNGSFEPRLIVKGQRRLPGFDERVIALYARG